MGVRLSCTATTKAVAPVTNTPKAMDAPRRADTCVCQACAANNATGGMTGKAYPISLELGIEKKPNTDTIQIQHRLCHAWSAALVLLATSRQRPARNRLAASSSNNKAHGNISTNKATA